MKFEAVFYKKWRKNVESIADGLMESPLLAWDPKRGRFSINLETHSLTIIREAKALQNLGLCIPQEATDLIIQENQLKSHMDRFYWQTIVISPNL